MGSQTSLKTSQRGGCNPLNPPPGFASVVSEVISIVWSRDKNKGITRNGWYEVLTNERVKKVELPQADLPDTAI